MKTINVFTENIFPSWNLDEKDVINKTKKMLEYYITALGEDSCLANE